MTPEADRMLNPERPTERLEEKAARLEADQREAGAETPSALLLRAATRLDEVAGAATPGPWRAHDTHLGQYGHAATILSGEGNDTDLRAWLPSMSQGYWDETRNVWADAAYMAAVDPLVGADFAGMLRAAAAMAQGLPEAEGIEVVAAAMVAARRILGVEA
ncbi:hypothetical protein [Actinacidiphila sp. ITFR-21]|uniref:hypothetical protein n=1 Tax=Actinacidiphila sp. ITFR-21 TaxID=3075199 RepID=UPI0028897F81|nr:hypothetical protein [Streptomyces sp. ITFR-21]WNI19212.1 hypothetical protein RLT57_29155 [Streptomyces sp. ITFR-21]